MPINGLGLPCLQEYKNSRLRDHFLLVARSDHTTRSYNIKLEFFKVQKMSRYASFCLIMGPFKGEVHVFARLWPIGDRVSCMTGAVWLAILATAGLFCNFLVLAHPGTVVVDKHPLNG